MRSGCEPTDPAKSLERRRRPGQRPQWKSRPPSIRDAASNRRVVKLEQGGAHGQSKPGPGPRILRRGLDRADRHPHLRARNLCAGTESAARPKSCRGDRIPAGANRSHRLLGRRRASALALDLLAGGGGLLGWGSARAGLDPRGDRHPASRWPLLVRGFPGRCRRDPICDRGGTAPWSQEGRRLGALLIVPGPDTGACESAVARRARCSSPTGRVVSRRVSKSRGGLDLDLRSGLEHWRHEHA